MGAEQMRKRSLGCRASSLFVEEILAADLVEGGKSAGPACDDLFRSHARLQLLDGVRVADEREKFRRIELFRIELLQNCRSEEHTSELQSLAYLVCRLLLEKKKKIQTRIPRSSLY